MGFEVSGLAFQGLGLGYLMLCNRSISWKEADRAFLIGAGDFILRVLITLKICGMPSYLWSMVSKFGHHLKLLHLFKLDGHSPTMARVIKIYQKHMTT